MRFLVCFNACQVCATLCLALEEGTVQSKEVSQLISKCGNNGETNFQKDGYSNLRMNITDCLWEGLMRFVPLQLKICEGCGNLWFRFAGINVVYCSTCLEKLACYPLVDAEGRSGRKKKAAWSFQGCAV